MESLLAPDRLAAAAFFLVPALLMGILFAVPRWRRADAAMPHLLVSTLGFAAWALMIAFEPGKDLTWLLLVSAGACFVLVTLTTSISGSPWLPAAAFFALALGAWVMPGGEAGLWLMAGLWFVLTCLGFALIVSGAWWSAAGYAVLFLILLSTAGWTSPALGGLLITTAKNLATVQLAVSEPWWLSLLLLLPLLVLWSYRSLAGLGPQRRRIALSLRCLLIALIAVALADVHVTQGSERMTVFVLWDRSQSIPAEIENGEDLRDRRMLDFLKKAVKLRGSAHQEDGFGLIVFGKSPRLELPPAVIPHLDGFGKLRSTIDDTYTDIGAAIKLALASFPEGTGKRIVLFSDGNENLGRALEQARSAKQNGVQIDVVPLGTGRKSLNEVLVERVEAPPVTDKDARLPVRVLLRSFNPKIVVGKLRLYLTRMDAEGGKASLQPQKELTPPEGMEVQLRLGLNVFFLKQPGIKREESYSFEAKFVPEAVIDPRTGERTEGLPGDKIENNRASTTVVASGDKAILLIEQKHGDQQLLVDRLRASKPNLKIITTVPADLPDRDADSLNLLLSRFDCVILANLPADRQVKTKGPGGDEEIVDGLSVLQQKVLRSNVHDQGCGMLVIGGPDSFGAGGWQNTELEKAWPVTCELESLKVDKKSGLVLIMHASEIADGNMWQKKIVKLAVDKLSPIDMVGVTLFDWQGGGGNNGHKWHIPFMDVGPNRARINGLINTLDPGDMPDAAPSLKMAYDTLTDPKHDLGTKHMIFISDGDHWDPPLPLLTLIKNANIKIATVCITSHGKDEITKMRRVALITGGQPYHVKNANELPAIYTRETRLISKSYVHDKQFLPVLLKKSGPTRDLPDNLRPLHGFVRTTPRPSPLVEVPIQTQKINDHVFPIFAHWPYGLGRVAVFTSDARTIPQKQVGWDKDWEASEMYLKFWDQVVDWTLRSVGNEKNLFLTTEQSGGKVKVIVTARDNNGQPLTNLELRGGITAPSMKEANLRKPALKFEQKNVGVYEAELKAEEVGSYFINVKASWTEVERDKDGKPLKDKKGKEIVVNRVGSVRTGLTIPYSPEFAEMECNTELLEELRKMTGGKSFGESTASLNDLAKSAELFRPAPVHSRALRPIWFWLIFLAGLVLLADVAVRRIALDAGEVVSPMRAFWGGLRHQAPAPTSVQFLDRLKARKAQVAGLTSERRFEAPAGPISAVPGAELDPGKAGKPAEPKPPSSKPAPEAEQDAGDFASRLLKAKRRALEDRDKKDGK